MQMKMRISIRKLSSLTLHEWTGLIKLAEWTRENIFVTVDVR